MRSSWQTLKVLHKLQNFNIQLTHIPLFGSDHSSCHRAFAEDALNAKVMNVKPGGAQPHMRDTVWAGKVQKIFDDGTPKGMRKVLEERGINTSCMLADNMRIVLSFHEDFRNEKTIVEHYLMEGVVFLLSSTRTSSHCSWHNIHTHSFTPQCTQLKGTIPEVKGDVTQ